MLNASYNLHLRGVRAYIPDYPVGTADECADMIHDFLPIAKAMYALQNLKIISLDHVQLISWHVMLRFSNFIIWVLR